MAQRYHFKLVQKEEKCEEKWAIFKNAYISRQLRCTYLIFFKFGM